MNEKTQAIKQQTPTIAPLCRIVENDGAVVLSVEMPGIPREGIEVRVEKDDLIISGKQPADTEKGEYLIRERRTGDYYKAFTIDNTIDREKIEAAHADGIMQLTLHVKESVKPRRIEIAAG